MKENNYYTKIENIESFIKKHLMVLQIFAGILVAIIILATFSIAYSDNFQNFAIFIGEKIKGRGLNHDYWKSFFTSNSIRLSILFSLTIIFFDCFVSFLIYRSKIETSVKLQNTVCIINCLFTFSFALVTIDGGNNWGGDFSEYIAQARSIVTNSIESQVRNNTFIIKNSPPMLGDAVYPWGFPFLLSPFYAIFGKNLFFLKIPGIICLAVSVIFSNLLFRKYFSFFQAELLTLFIGINPCFIFFCNSPLSDIPFLCFSMITLYFIEKLFNNNENSYINGILVGLFSFLSFMTRSNGIVFICLLLALHALMVARKNKKINLKLNKLGFEGFSKAIPMAHILPYIIFTILYLIQRKLLPQAGGTHIHYLNMITAHSIIRNIKYYVYVFCDFFPFIKSFLYSWLIVFFVYGFIKYMFKYPILSIYFLGAMGILILWPALQGIRFCFPAIPVMMIFTGLGINDFLKILKNKGFTSLGIVIELAIIVLCIPILVQKGKSISNEYEAYSKEAKEVYNFINTNTLEEDKIIFFKPRVLYLETGRLGFQTNDIKRLNDADYLLLSKDGYSTFNYEIEIQYPNETENLDKIFENEKFKFYKIK